MTPEHVGIAELSRQHNVTQRTLRFYESKGLVAPARDGRRRLYRPTDCERLAKAIKWRKLGFTVRETKSLLNGSGEFKEAIEGQIAALNVRLAETEAAIAELQAIASKD